MATVRLSERLKGEILENASKLFTNRLRDMQVFPLNEDSVAARVVEAHISNLGKAPVWEAMPPEWKVSTNNVHIRRINEFRPARRTYMRTSTTVHVPNNLGYLEITSPMLDDIVDVWSDWEKRCAELEAERNKFYQTVRVFLERHTTLKQALNEWPGIMELLPVDAKERHEAETVRTARDENDTFDPTDLTRVVVTAKIVGDGA